MSEIKQNGHQPENLDTIQYQPRRGHSWKRIHHTLGFWVFVVLMLAAITYYVMSVDFAFAPHKQLNEPPGNNIAP